MTMIVREMIVLDQECFKPSSPLEFSDDSGWLGPPRAVPFAWEVAPGTPKQEKCSNSSSPSPNTSSGMESEAEHVQENESLESGRHSIHILDSAPDIFLIARNSEVCGELVNPNSEGAVPFKWEMEPGIPRDPDKCRQILDCPLTPPPVLHSRSLVIHSSMNKGAGVSPKSNLSGRISLSARMKSLLWIHPHRPKQQDFLMRAGPQGEVKSKKSKTKVLLLKDTPESYPGESTKKNSTSDDGQSDEDDLSPVSVLEYNNSLRLSSSGKNNRRPSSVSSSARSIYHTPKESFSWESQPASPSLSSSRSFKSSASREASSKRNSLYSLLALKNKLMLSKRESHEVRSSPGCLMLLGNNRSSSFTSEEANLSDFNSSSTSETKSSSLSPSDSSSPSLPEEEVSKQSKVSDAEAPELSSDEDGHSVYFSPAPKLRNNSFSFHPDNTNDCSENSDRSDFSGFAIIERVDSLETIDPGFAPSEIGDEKYQSVTILNRMTSCARWQKRQASTKARGSQLARSLLGRARVTVCCYVPAREED